MIKTFKESPITIVSISILIFFGIFKNGDYFGTLVNFILAVSLYHFARAYHINISNKEVKEND